MNDDREELQKVLDNLRKQSDTPKENLKNANAVKKIPLQENAEDALEKYQRYHMEEKYIEAVEKDFESRKKVRGRFLTFYIWFMSIVTVLIFFVIIDPVGLITGKSIYGDDLKLSLVGVFFANLISIALIMVKYSFAPIDNILKAFERLNKIQK